MNHVAAPLYSRDLEANVMEWVDCMGFHLLSHVPESQARLRIDDAELTLRQELRSRMPVRSEPMGLPAGRTRIVVSAIFDIYVKLVRRVRHKLSGPPRLSPAGQWEFSVSDSFGHVLCFSQNAKNQVFNLASDTQALPQAPKH